MPDSKRNNSKMPDSEKGEDKASDSEKDNAKESDSQKKYPKCKNMMYEQQIEHLPAGTIEQLVERIEKLAPKKYALIIHDKDVNEQGNLQKTMYM